MADPKQDQRLKKPPADGAAAPAKPTPPAEPKESPELAELRDQLLRVRADFENYKRRAEDQRAQMVQVARTDVILDLLPVIDNFERAFADVPDQVAKTTWYGGVSAIKSQFEKVLDGLGIKRITTVGEPFNPELHEAIAHEASDQAENIIIKEFEAGYRLGDHVIRHARVNVSSGQTDSKSERKDSDGE